ncbi:MAG: IS1595 family transposase [Candidatus Humimicrobiaceae bacterium]
MANYTIKDFNNNFPDNDSCLEWLKNHKYPKGIICDNPKCKKYNSIAPHHKITNRMCYSCDYCGSHVYPMADTIFEKSTTELKYWFHAVYIISSTRCGISAKQLQREIGVTYKTAWRIFHLIKEMLYQKPVKGNGKFEADETYIGGKRTGKVGRGAENKTIVFGVYEREGKLFAKKIDNVKSSTLIPLIKENTIPNAIIYTDEYPSYNKLNEEGYIHEIVNHANKIYVINDVHVNSIEGFWSLLKRGINGVYHSVSPKHLDKYINEYVFRYNNRKNIDTMFYLMLTSACQSF